MRQSLLYGIHFKTMIIINLSRIKEIYAGLDFVRPVSNVTIFYFGVKEPVRLTFKSYKDAEKIAEDILRHGNKGEVFYKLPKPQL